VKKESLRHRTNADTRTKISASPITVKTPPQRDDKSNAESKNSIATKIQSPQPSQSNAESRMNAIAAKTETSQSSQLDDETVIKKAMVTIAAKMDNPASAVFLDVDRAARKDAFGFYRHNLRPRERQVGRRHRRQALSIRRSKRRGLYWRLRFSYGRISQYLQLRTEYRPWGLSRQRAACAVIAELTCAGTFRRRSTH
jgi:hypothetical protein